MPGTSPLANQASTVRSASIGTYDSPPCLFPKKGDRLPKDVRIWTPSIQRPDLTTKPVMYSPLRISARSWLATPFRCAATHYMWVGATSKQLT